MSVEAYLMPLARWMRGRLPVPMEKFCRGKGVVLFEAQVGWSLAPDAARAEAAGWWRLATGEPAPEPDQRETHAELIDAEGLARLRTFAAAGPGGAARYPHLLAAPWRGGTVYFPTPVASVQRVRRCGDEAEIALGSSPALAAELDGLAGRLGPTRDWGDVGEGDFACPHDDPRFAEKTAWSILRFLARESERRDLPLILPPTEW